MTNDAPILCSTCHIPLSLWRIIAAWPTCGATGRTYAVPPEGRSVPTRRPLAQLRTLSEFFRRTAVWARVMRLINRRGNLRKATW